MVWNALHLALREVRRNVLRSLLTMLGIVIGVAAVIVMVTIGGGATVQVTEQIASLGTNLLIVTPGMRVMGPGGTSGAAPFRVADAEAIGRDVPSIAAVAPVSTRSMTAIFGNQNWSTRVSGTTNEYLKAGNWAIEAGREFSASELRAGTAVCIVGATVRTRLFGAQDPMGSTIRLEKLACQVIGLLGTKGQTAFGMDQDDVVLIPLRTFQRRITGNEDVAMLQVSFQQGVSAEKVERDIGRLMRERRHLSATQEDDFSVRDLSEITKMLTGTTRMLTALLSAVAAVSLLVGGIGIMNIMLVSVTERTREIGIRLAIGALEREVLLQFLVEAMVLSSLGGLIGVIVALVASMQLSKVLMVPFVFTPGIIILACVFSAAVGMVFGYFPAQRAARLNPIDALRHE
ncbi:MAG: ABC transporter permease [Nitrospirota bacterium]